MDQDTRHLPGKDLLPHDSGEADYDCVKDFAAVVHYSPKNDPDREVQIVRIDTAHGYTHLDRLYRRDQPKERVDVDVWEAAALLQANWRTYAESFDDLHRA